MTLRGALLGLAFVPGALLTASEAGAVVILTYDGTNYPGQITAQAEFTFTDVVNPPYDVDLSLEMTNTSSITGSLTGFGFDLPDGSFISFAFDQTNG